MNGKQLRNSILQWAISGRLVPQDPSDEPASELLKRINPKAVPLNPDDAPFDVPDSWCWCKVGDIGNIITGSTPSKSIKDYYNGDIPFFKPTDLEQGINVCESGDHISELGYKQSRQLPPNSILVTCIGATIGKTGLTTVAGTCNQQINAIVPNNVVLPLYVYFACVSDCMQTKIKTNASATTLPILNKGNFARLPFPLPPLAEQERIVKKVEELLPLVERYDKAQTEMDRLNASLKGKLRASVLQEAIAGRLVPQDPNDEPAIELLKRINPKAAPLAPDDAPFPIPDSWCWVRHNDIFEVSGGSQPPKNNFIDTPKSGYVRLYQIRDYGEKPVPVYVPKDMVSKFTKKGDILLARYGASLGKVFWAEEGAYNVAMAKVIPLYQPELINKQYIYLFYCSDTYRSFIRNRSRCAQAGFNRNDLNELCFPLPPLAEQERIVGKVEELLAVLDALQ